MPNTETVYLWEYQFSSIQFNTQLLDARYMSKHYSMFWMQGFRVYTALSWGNHKTVGENAQKLTLTQHDKHNERGGGHVIST